MILLVDIGNSRTKWVFHHAGQWLCPDQAPTGETGTLAAAAHAHAPTAAVLSCVADKAVASAVKAALPGCPAHWLRPSARGHGLVNDYAAPEQLGPDRYAGLLACHRRGLAPCVLASAGTALTVDALTGEGVFLGGMILPGLSLMRQALAGGTARLAVAAGDWQAFPRSTASAIATGALTAHVATIQALRQRLEDRLGQPAGLVLTGGDAAQLAPLLPSGTLLERQLVLEGLLWLARDLGLAAD
ncbi:MAG: type III pantothenate kinase [Pseudomonadota bacterium]